eukprot:gene19465-23274_t
MNKKQEAVDDRDMVFESAVLKYLKQKGYKSAEEAFKHEAKVHSSEHMAIHHTLDVDTSVTNQVLFYNSEENDPNRYKESYSKLRDWVESSLDQYKNELSRIMYPVFIHCFLDLIEKDYVAQAREFLDSFLPDHQRLHSAEMKKLQGLGAPGHIDTNDQAKIFRRNKFNVKLCHYSFDLLLRFLHNSGFMLLLSIINERISVKVSPGQPEPLVEEDETVTTITGKDPADTSAINGKEGKWGVLPVQEALERKAKENAEGEDDKEGGKEDGPPAKKTKKDATKAVGATAVGGSSSAASVALEVIQSDIPLPKLDEKAEQSMLSDLRRRVQVNSASLPSVCFYSFHNTSNMLNCVALSSTCGLAVGGFSDSVIKVWDFDAEAKAEPRADTTSADDASGSRSKGPSARLFAHSGPVFAVDFSPDHAFLFSSAGDNTVRLWNMQLKANLVCYKGHNYPVWDVRCSPMGYYFATASHDRTARVWTVDNVNPVRIMAGHLADVDTVQWHPNCNYIATGSSDKT